MMAREAAKQMEKSGGGSIVFITSNSALGLRKTAVHIVRQKVQYFAMSKSFAVDWGKYGIRSNCVLPGMIKTQRWENNANNCRYSLANYTPIEDIADFSDIAKRGVVFCKRCRKGNYRRRTCC